MPLYSLALTLALILGAPVWLLRLARLRRLPRGLRQRFGFVPATLAAAVRGRKVVWLHAVSVGETIAAAALVRDLQKTLPGYAIVVSTTTPTGQEVAREHFGADRVFFYPLDLRFAVRRWLRALQPELLILMESELWPRMLVECERAGIPVAVVNARVSDRSLPRYLALRPLWRPLLRRVRLILAQTEADAGRWMRIGMPFERVRTTGNLKFDSAVPANSRLAFTLRTFLPPGARVLVAGSTHSGEESQLLRCFANTRTPGRVLLLAPRQPHRGDGVATQAMSMGFRAKRLSAWRRNPAPIAEGDVLVLDTIGDLGALYSLASCAFVGGSLVPQGGHNPLEPAQFGLPIFMGESFENFRDMVGALQRAEAIFIVHSANLCERLRAGLEGTAPWVTEAAARARDFYLSQAGATERTVAALLPLLGVAATSPIAPEIAAPEKADSEIAAPDAVAPDVAAPETQTPEAQSTETQTAPTAGNARNGPA